MSHRRAPPTPRSCGSVGLARIFLSYAREDRASIEGLAAALFGAGHDVWWDRQIGGGTRFSEEIDAALRDCDAVVVLWSPAAAASTWVLDEAAEGRDAGKLVPITLGEFRPPLGFRQYQSIDIGHWTAGTELPAELDDALGRLTKSGAPAPAAPVKTAAANRIAVCVLPFLNMSGDVEQDYFSDGISEDIITDLSKVSSLSVIARNTAFAFKGQSVDIKDVARQLGVSHVLEGSVRKAGSRVRITAQLIDGKAGDHLWAERYDRDLDDIFAIQDEISRAIVAALKLKLLPKEKSAIAQRGTTSAEAYNLYLMAHQYWIQGNWGDIRQLELVVKLCQRAIDIDPSYARALGLMAIVLNTLHNAFNQSDEDGTAAAERALAIDPSLAEPHCVIARRKFEDGDIAGAEASVARALELDPDSWAVQKEAARLAYHRGEIEQSAVHFARAVEIDPKDFYTWGMLVGIYPVVGMPERRQHAAEMAIAESERALMQDPTNGAAIISGVAGLAALGQNDRAREWIARAQLMCPDNDILRYNLACCLSDLGEVEAALDMLETVRKPSSSVIFAINSDPDLAPLRGNPRYQPIVDRLEATARAG
ncbi:TIR domain-containing protein [Sphingomonas sabuli]|uniref:TIR domain-containing protein n=1 Tax=Sphingomonas sabuli TaxID=2764186 RepID=A0A7G9L181_9SPHN|nr:TIR domain-containing protein [Sphingomonas sabuli]QNM82380.1 TIR domain-containing protein [Sphingomonas sabuli]